MRKRIVVMVLAMAISSSLFTGCGNDSPKQTLSSFASTTPASLAEIPSLTVKDNKLSDKITVKEYSFMVESKLRIVAYYVTNTADKDAQVSMNIVARNSSGDPISVKEPTAQTIAPNTSTVISAWLNDVTMDNPVEYLMDVSSKVDLPSAAADIKLEQSIKNNKVIITATNNGSATAQTIHVQAIFLSKGKMVGFTEKYLFENNNELKPGESRLGEIECYHSRDFDEVLLGCTANIKKQ